jgi:hypothetical protein
VTYEYSKSAQRQANADRRSQADREPFRRARAAARLKPFDWGDPDLGVRRSDVGVFLAAARGFNHIVLVRATNPASLGYIGHAEAVPKPIDCKAKTADRDVYIPRKGILAHTAGLVVDPDLVGADAYKEGKHDKARDEWQSFLKNKTRDEIARKVYRRRGDKGFFAVDTDASSFYYGCLMISRQDIPQDFDEAIAATTRWRRPRMQYIHGDYDLYALLNADSGNGPTQHNKVYGVDNYYSPTLPAIQDFVNRGIGAPMIQHGEQFRYKHQGDRVYAFYPDGSSYRFDEGTASIEEMFEVVFQV